MTFLVSLEVFANRRLSLAKLRRTLAQVIPHDLDPFFANHTPGKRAKFIEILSKLAAGAGYEDRPQAKRMLESIIRVSLTDDDVYVRDSGAKATLSLAEACTFIHLR